MNLHFSTPSRAQRDFNLIELTIALTIIGLVVAGIWVAADNTFRTRQVTYHLEQLISTYKGTRNIWAGQSLSSLCSIGSGTCTLTTAMQKAGAIPADLKNPWGGTIDVKGYIPSAGYEAIQIVSRSVPKDACNQLFNKLVGALKNEPADVQMNLTNTSSAVTTPIQHPSAWGAMPNPCTDPVSHVWISYRLN